MIYIWRCALSWLGVPDLGEGEVLILGGDILCARHFKKDGNLRRVYKDFLQKCADNFACASIYKTKKNETSTLYRIFYCDAGNMQ